MLFKRKTHQQLMRENRAWVEKQKRKDAPKIAKMYNRWERECKWHNWFALWPVDVADGKTAWLQTVERRIKYRMSEPRIVVEWMFINYEYRLKDDATN